MRSLTQGRLIPDFVPNADPLLLPLATIFVPNRRTARALRIAFLEAGGSNAQLLPKIKTLGDVDEDNFGLISDASDFDILPNSVGHLERKLRLTSLIQKWVDTLSHETRRLYGDEDIFIPSSQADAVRLAEDLCRLLDQFTQEEIDWHNVRKIIPDEHAKWWSITSTFMQIVMENWPKLLAEDNLVDPAERSRQLIDQRIERYRRHGSVGPVIVAGSTGSVPSTQRFLEVISRLSNGAIVLPGVDKTMPVEEWEKLVSDPINSSDTLESHPQYGLATLLNKIGVTRDNVSDLAGPELGIVTRTVLTSTALSLPQFSSDWKKRVSSIDDHQITQAFEHVALIEAANERQEATAIAIALRETLESPKKTAALVTPDRNLARRVAVELRRFGIAVDDTAGKPLQNSKAGAFIRLLVRFCFRTNSRSELVELLKSPLFIAGRSEASARELAELIELHGLRGAIGDPLCGELSDFFADRFARLSERRHYESKLNPEDDQVQLKILEYASWLDEVCAKTAVAAASQRPQKLSSYISDLGELLDNLTADEDGNSAFRTTSGSVELYKLFEEIISTAASDFEIYPQDFPSVFDALMLPVTVRGQGVTHPRLHVYGPLEIRLLDYDRVVMAGLNEGTWPQSTRNDSFLNRTMRHQLGMASPERRIGLSAHDFQQMMGKHEVILSRASRVDKAPTISSRWLQRLFALLGESVTQEIRQRGNRYVSYAIRLDDENERAGRQTRPNPMPPLQARPKSLPVTDIETWIRDPYALYAKRILKLKALQPLERDADHLLRGTLYHAILEEYVSPENMCLPAEVRLPKLQQIARKQIAAQKLSPEVELVWKYRFYQLAKQFVDWETKYSANSQVLEIFKEVDGKIKLAEGVFTLRARADRVDTMESGNLFVMDYKTGSSPSPKQARTLSPQLALEGVIAQAGGFDGIQTSDLEDVAFFRLFQGKGFGTQKISDKNNPLSDIISNAKSNLEELIAHFQDENTGYVSRRAPFRDGDISGDYDHLARTREWSFGEEGESDE